MKVDRKLWKDCLEEAAWAVALAARFPGEECEAGPAMWVEHAGSYFSVYGLDRSSPLHISSDKVSMASWIAVRLYLDHVHVAMQESMDAQAEKALATAERRLAAEYGTIPTN